MWRPLLSGTPSRQEQVWQRAERHEVFALTEIIPGAHECENRCNVQEAPLDWALVAAPTQMDGEPPYNRSIEQDAELDGDDGIQPRVFAEGCGQEVQHEDQWRVGVEQPRIERFPADPALAEIQNRGDVM